MKQKVIDHSASTMLNWYGLHYGSTKRCLIALALSILMVVSGGLIMHYQPIAMYAKSHMQLSPNSFLFKFFQNPPIDVTISVYVFNVTNAEAFLSRQDKKIKVEEVGPYVYQEDLLNVNPVFNDNGTLTFTSRRYLTFRRDLSVGDVHEDTIISPNIPLLGISSFMKGKSAISNMVVNQIANILNVKQFLNLTINEYLWGYDDKLVTLAHSALPNWINFRRFGIMDRLMALDNASNVVTIKTNWEPVQSAILNEEERRAPFTVQKFNGLGGLPQWGYEETSRNVSGEHNNRCNSLEGVYESPMFAMDAINENTTIWQYRRSFCRPLPTTFDSYSEWRGADTFRTVLRPDYLDLPEDNPDNACYCNVHGIKCRYKGIGYLNPCYYGMAITISSPHFYNADPRLQTHVEGLRPDERLHKSMVEVSRYIGVPVNGSMRIQINMEIDTRLSTRCKPFNGLMIPLFWLEVKPHKLHFVIYVAMYGLQYGVPIITGLLSWLLIIFGVAIAATATLFRLCGSNHHGFEDPYDNNIGYAPIKVIPVSIYSPPSIRIS